MAVVTISGQTGTGAREIGRLAAERLRIDYVDQQILMQAARELGVPMESVVPFDERAAGLGERLAGMLRRFLERSAAAGMTDPMLGTGGLELVLGRSYGEAAAGEGPQEISDERYLTTLDGVVRDLAAQGNVLIIGRGSQVVLKDRPDAVHLLLIAPLAHRIAFIAQRDGVSSEEAARRVHDGDRGRAAFHQKFFKVTVDDPALYHLTLNTGRFSIDEAAEMIGHAAGRVAASGKQAPSGAAPASGA